jgi:hypothetical protein
VIVETCCEHLLEGKDLPFLSADKVEMLLNGRRGSVLGPHQKTNRIAKECASHILHLPEREWKKNVISVNPLLSEQDVLVAEASH